MGPTVLILNMVIVAHIESEIRPFPSYISNPMGNHRRPP